MRNNGFLCKTIHLGATLLLILLLAPPSMTSTAVNQTVLGVAGAAKPRYPAVFLCHGGGPLPLLNDPAHHSLLAAWHALMDGVVARHGLPRAIVVISAHYETAVPSVGGAKQPKMLYDYGGFPEAAYRFKYPAPGDPTLAQRIVHHLAHAGISAEMDEQHPFDHGVFVPLYELFPKADIPVVPLSVLASHNAAAHIAMGRALAPLRSEGVLFIGSGSTMHNMRYLMTPGKTNVYGQTFNDALSNVLCNAALQPSERLRRMEGVASFPGIAESHPPRALEHLMPLLTCTGLADGEIAVEASNVPFLSGNVRQYVFEN